MKSMKKIYTLAASFLLCAGLVSCEMKDEIFGGTESAEKGYLNLGVAVNSSENTVVTRAEGDGVTDDGKNTDSAVSADDFPVDITCTTNPHYSRSFASYADLMEENPIELSVGTYTVSAHSNLTLEKKMPVPYYEGVSETLTITKDVESKADVECKMKNTKIQMKYNSEFLAKFDTWTITIDDGTENLNGEGNVLTFTESDKNPAAVYWLIAENKNKIMVNITATNMDGETVTDSRTLTKPAGGNTEFWTGGDALTITMEGITPDPGNPSGVTGIDISVDVTFDEEEETVEVPVTPGTGEGEPEDSNLDISITPDTYTLPTDMEKTAEVSITTSAANGLTSVIVQITPDNSGFGQALNGVGLIYEIDFLNGAEIIDNDNLENIVSEIAPGLTAPATGAKEYTFPVHSFFDAINGSGATSGTGHVFKITVKDADGNTAEKSITVAVSE